MVRLVVSNPSVLFCSFKHNVVCSLITCNSIQTSRRIHNCKREVRRNNEQKGRFVPRVWIQDFSSDLPDTSHNCINFQQYVFASRWFIACPPQVYKSQPTCSFNQHFKRRSVISENLTTLWCNSNSWIVVLRFIYFLSWNLLLVKQERDMCWMEVCALSRFVNWYSLVAYFNGIVSWLPFAPIVLYRQTWMTS